MTISTPLPFPGSRSARTGEECKIFPPVSCLSKRGVTGEDPPALAGIEAKGNDSKTVSASPTAVDHVFT